MTGLALLAPSKIPGMRQGGGLGNDGARIAELDGVRGVAALVVVIHHILLASSPILAAEYAGGPAKHWSSLWWLVDTPLHLFWAGPEAVVVFFVLSGFVLALPAVRHGRRWFRISYYPKRLTRLYLPVWASIALAALWRSLEARPRLPGSSWWLQQHSTPMTLHRAVTQGTLRDLGTWAFNPVLWSLHWEVLYSALLPVALLLVVCSRRHRAASLGLLLAALVGVGWGTSAGDSRAQFLPMFVVGALLAVHCEWILRTLRSVKSIWIYVLSVSALFFLTSNYWLSTDRVGGFAQKALAGTKESLVVLGATTAIGLAFGRPSWSGVLQSRSMRWLGSRSYSIYLVHEPIVVAIAYVLKARESSTILLSIVLPLSLGAAELFWRAVERPSIRIARLVGDLVDRLAVPRSRAAQTKRMEALATTE